ncbi:MAG: hypothetical protein JXA08_09905 [Methanomicrobiaceae archaeon]|nr:hypothetical protein [Methanomicrobiaceae archaeon]
MALRDRVPILRAALLAVLVLGIALVVPVAAATESITITKYADNNYAQSVASETFNLSQLQALSSVYSNGPVYMQGPTFDSGDPWGDGGQNMINYYDHNGTLVSTITDEVGGMSDGDELKIQASDGMSRYFGYDNVYTPDERQGDMIVAWWDSVYGFVPAYTYGMRLFFYTPGETYGVADSLNLTLRDMQASFDPWYSYNYSATWPSAKGLSEKYVRYLKIYPPHRHDFNATGETDEYAYRFETSSRPAASIDIPSMAFTSSIADNDSTFQTDFSPTNFAAHRFNFTIDTATDKDGPLSDIEKFVITWNGKGWHGSGGTSNGTYLYIWNQTGYEELTHSDSGDEETLIAERSQNIGNYVNSGNVTVLAVQKTKSAGLFLSNIATDYVKLEVFHHHSN